MSYPPRGYYGARRDLAIGFVVAALAVILAAIATARGDARCSAYFTNGHARRLAFATSRESLWIEAWSADDGRAVIEWDGDGASGSSEHLVPPHVKTFRAGTLPPGEYGLTIRTRTCANASTLEVVE